MIEHSLSNFPNFIRIILKDCHGDQISLESTLIEDFFIIIIGSFIFDFRGCFNEKI